MSNTTSGTTRNKPGRSRSDPPAQATSDAPSQAMSDVAWVADEPTREAMIRLAAYTIYERCGYVSGSELKDWLEAEMEVDRQLAATPPSNDVPGWTPEHAHPIHAMGPVQTRARMPVQKAAKSATRAPAKAPLKATAKAAKPPSGKDNQPPSASRARTTGGSAKPTKAR